MISKLSLKNFRLLRSVEIDFHPGTPIVLIGPNSSGKTSVLEALDLLRCAATEGLSRAWASGMSLQTAGTYDGFELSVIGDGTPWDVDIFDGAPPEPLSYSLTASFRTVRKESLCTYSQGLEKAPTQVLARNEAQAWIRNTKTGQRDIWKPSHDELSFQAVRQNQLYPELSFASEVLSKIRVYGEFLTTPSWLRDPREGNVSPCDSAILAPTASLGRRGLDLVNALYHIQNEQEHGWAELMDAFRAEFPFVSKLEFPADPSGGRIGLAWRDQRYPGVRMSGYQLSEGMIAYLCLLAAIFSVDRPAILGFDEPDVHLHPSALRRLVHLLEEGSRRSPIIITTHSDRLLDYLSDPAASLRTCQPTRDGAEIGTVDRDALDEWRKSYAVSELRERGHIDARNEDTHPIEQ